MNLFFELIQMAIGGRDTLTEVPKERPEWEALLEVAGKHNLVALTFPAIDILHDQAEVPLGIYSKWAMTAEQVKEKNARMIEACLTLSEKFPAYGFRTCILKGQAAAAYYPFPERRQCGDIDIWLDAPQERIVAFLKEHFKVAKVVYHHAEVKMLKGIGVEVHFTPSWMNSPCANRRLQKYFRSKAEEQFGHRSEALGFCVPTRRFDAVYMLIHIYRHVLDEGIGLRQLLDYYYVLKALTPEDREAALKDIKHLKLLKFAAGVMYVLQKVFALDSSFMLTEPDSKQGEFLLNEILVSGNFGMFDSRNKHSADETRVMHAKRKMTRAMRYLSYYPSEVLNIPVFMVFHYFWRLSKGYLK